MALELLPREEVEDIHQATLRVLAETGIQLSEPKALALLLDAGANRVGKRVLIPPELVDECISIAGKRFTIQGRGGNRKTLGDGRLCFHNLGGAPQVYESKTGLRRPASVQDIQDATRLLDALDHCDTITPFFTPNDVPGHIMSLAMYRHVLPFTLKPVQGPGIQYPLEVDYAVKMAAVIGVPQEVLSLSLSPVSPLRFPDHEAAAIMEIASHGIPFAPLPCPTAGTTAPMSIYGAVIQQNAEVLAAMVLAQLARPGLPMIYCGRLAMMEPRTGLSVWGGVELGLASAITVQLGHKYGFAVNVYGFSTNSHSHDTQNGFERGLNAILPALAGADELSGIGEMEAGVMGSYAQMVLDNEFAASILRARKGIIPDPEAVDVINVAVMGKHNFLSQKHTMMWLRDGEISVTKLAERGSWENWSDHGRAGILERAQVDAERILGEHSVPALEPAQERELDALLHSAEIECAN